MANRKATKGEETRERIFQAALGLFGQKGFAATTMREIAQAADCSLGLAYRYFDSKEAMVVVLYERLVAEFAEEVASLPSTTLAERWATAARRDIVRLQQHRGALAGLTAAGLQVDTPTQVLGSANAALRREMLQIFHQVVVGAKDAPHGTVADALSALLYAVHLLLVLFWLQDPSPEQRVTMQLIGFGEELLTRFRLVLRLPWVGGAMVRLAGILLPVLDGTAS